MPTPVLHVVIPTFNEQENITKCLAAIFRNQPRTARLIVTIVDDKSTDQTVELAKKFPVNILYSGLRDAEISKIVGFKSIKCDYLMYLDADIEIIGHDWFDRLLAPLLIDENIAGSFPSFEARASDGAWVRAAKSQELELDPLLGYFCVPISQCIISIREDFIECDFSYDRIPPVGVIMYRSRYVWPIIEENIKFMDIDVPILLARLGYSRFAYVPNCKMHHDSYSTIKELIRKRLRNLTQVFLPSTGSRVFVYFSPSSRKDIIKILILPLYAIAILPEAVKSYHSWSEKRDLAVFLRPFILPILTFAIGIKFLSEKRGRAFITSFFLSAIR